MTDTMIRVKKKRLEVIEQRKGVVDVYIQEYAEMYNMPQGTAGWVNW